MNAKELLARAHTARKAAYAPYSGFSVGAALLSKDGRVFCGCNVENAAYTPTCCAERVALFSAVAAGVREFSAIAVVGGADEEAAKTRPCYPCGVCRQALSEFSGDGSLAVYLKNGEEGVAYRLSELLPHSFDADQLK